MPQLPPLPEEAVVRIVSRADPREFALFLGAGASRSSGVPQASEMIGEWRDRAWREQCRTDEPRADWLLRQAWYRSDTEYSTLFEMLYPNQRARQSYVELKIEKAFPSWGYVYLANIIRAGHFNVVFTTNFDDLINEALTRFLRYNPVVCAAESDVETINVSTARAKIIKLHGDYLFRRLKNTVEELEELDPMMARKFREFGQQSGLVVLGYHGADRSVMHAIEDVLMDPNAFPTGIYWSRRPDAQPMPRYLETLADKYPKRLRLFECTDFDVIMARLHSELKLPTPLTIVDALEGFRANFERLRTITDIQRANDTIRADLALIEQQHSGAIGQAQDLAAIDLFETKIALGQRDYQTALAHIESYSAKKPLNADALTAWGTALRIRAEEEGATELLHDAIVKWREAVKLDARWLPARYELARHFSMTQQHREALIECEALAELAPNDLGLRKNLAGLYVNAGRLDEALRIVDELLTRETGNAELHMSRAMLLHQRGLVAEAVAEMQQLVRDVPANPRVHFALASLLAQTGQHQHATSEFLLAVQLDPNNASYRIQTAITFLAINQPFQALPHLEAAVQKEPRSAEARAWLAQTLLMVGRSAEAVTEIQEALRLNERDARILATAGTIYMHTNEMGSAETSYRTAIERNPQMVPAYAELATLYWRQKRGPDYQNIMQRLAQVNTMAAQHVHQVIQMQAAHMQAPFAHAAAFGGNSPAAPQGSPWGQGGDQPNWLNALSKLLRF